MSNRFLAFMACVIRAAKKEASMRCASSKLQTRARILELGLNAAQPRNWPPWLSTRTVSPASPPPLAIAPSKIQGWRRSNERSLPSLSRIVFIPLLSWLESLQKHRQRAQELGAGNGSGQPDLGGGENH